MERRGNNNFRREGEDRPLALVDGGCPPQGMGLDRGQKVMNAAEAACMVNCQVLFPVEEMV